VCVLSLGKQLGILTCASSMPSGATTALFGSFDVVARKKL